MIPFDPVFADINPREWAKQLAVLSVSEHPRVFRERCRAVFEVYGHPFPDDLFAWMTGGVVTDVEADTWDNLLPDQGRFGIQMRQSTALNVGRDGPIEYIRPVGEVIWHGE
ncbi:MAG: hypothetical protein AAF922_05835 [Pseudomonadota bacterium]